jgi:peroxiredoxin
LAAQAALKAKGVDEVIIYCVNDCAVMTVIKAKLSALFLAIS